MIMSNYFVVGWNDIGYHNDAVQTPVLDELALNGRKLESAYSLPACSPLVLPSVHHLSTHINNLSTLIIPLGQSMSHTSSVSSVFLQLDSTTLKEPSTVHQLIFIKCIFHYINFCMKIVVLIWR